MPIIALLKNWGMVVFNWLFSDVSEGDLTLLGVLFTLNASFSSVDILIHGIVSPLRTKLRKRLNRYRDAKWMRAIAPSENERDQGKRDVLNALVNDVTSFESEIPELFKGTARTWKWIMATVSAVTLLLMAIPYSGRIVVLLALTIPGFYLHCRIELRNFNKKLDAACSNLDKSYKAIKDNCATSNSLDNVADRLSVIESKINPPKEKSIKTKRSKKKS